MRYIILLVLAFLSLGCEASLVSEKASIIVPSPNTRIYTRTLALRLFMSIEDASSVMGTVPVYSEQRVCGRYLQKACLIYTFRSMGQTCFLMFTLSRDTHTWTLNGWKVQ